VANPDLCFRISAENLKNLLSASAFDGDGGDRTRASYQQKFAGVSL
jgi:hypothetical protein